MSTDWDLTQTFMSAFSFKWDRIRLHERAKAGILRKLQSPLNTHRQRASLYKAKSKIESELVLYHLNLENFCRLLTNEQLLLAVDTYVLRVPTAVRG